MTSMARYYAHSIEGKSEEHWHKLEDHLQGMVICRNARGMHPGDNV